MSAGAPFPCGARGLHFGPEAVRALLRDGGLPLPEAAAKIRTDARLFWVREAFRLEALWDDAAASAIAATSLPDAPVWFEADRGAPSERSRSPQGHPFGRLRPAIVMPRWASRLLVAWSATGSGRFIVVENRS